MKKLFILVVALAVCIGLQAQTVRQTFRHAGTEREYWIFVPDSIGPQRPLVFFLHGYGKNADGYFPALVETARKHGFVLCYPQGLKDPGKGKPGWNVGYPSQEGWQVDDVDFLLKLQKHLLKQYKLNGSNCFFSGMSNGGEMCYIMAYEHPESWAAICSLAGLTMEWLYRSEYPAAPVPFMEVHGTADRTSYWEGDPENKGGWGRYVAVPLAVGRLASVNDCTHELRDTLVRYTPESNTVVRHRYVGGTRPGTNGGPSEVRLYEVIGGKHSFGHKDMDVTEEMWDFFKQYLR